MAEKLRFNAGDRLIEASPKALGQRVPEPLHARLIELCDAVYQSGEPHRPTKADLLAALILAAPEEPADLVELLKRYGHARVADASVGGPTDAAVVELAHRNPGPRRGPARRGVRRFASAGGHQDWPFLRRADVSSACSGYAADAATRIAGVITMILIPAGLRGIVKLVAIDLRGQRVAAKLQTIERYLAFGRKHHLIKPDEETQLVEMLVEGLRFELAIAELRALRAGASNDIRGSTAPQVAKPGPPEA